MVPVMGGDGSCSILAPIQNHVGQTVSTNDGQEPLRVDVGPATGAGSQRRRRQWVAAKTPVATKKMKAATML